MRLRVKVSRRAAGQIRSAAEWWLQHRDKAPDALAEEIERAFDLIQVLPHSGQRIRHPTIPHLRRLHLARIHYYLYYQLIDDEEFVEVLSLWHVRRGQPPEL